MAAGIHRWPRAAARRDGVKCSRCGHDSKYRERSGRICPQCKKAFAFEPRESDPVTDMLFKNAITAVSAQGWVRFGVEHLYYEVCRRTRRQAMPLGITILSMVCSLASGVMWLAETKQRGLAFVVLITGGIGLKSMG